VGSLCRIPGGRSIEGITQFHRGISLILVKSGAHAALLREGTVQYYSFQASRSMIPSRAAERINSTMLRRFSLDIMLAR